MMHQMQVNGSEILVKRCLSLDTWDLESYVCVIMKNVMSKINNVKHLLNIFIVAACIL